MVLTNRVPRPRISSKSDEFSVSLSQPVFILFTRLRLGIKGCMTFVLRKESWIPGLITDEVKNTVRLDGAVLAEPQKYFIRQ